MHSLIKYLWLIPIILSSTTAAQSGGAGAPVDSRVLFVGDSLTYWNDGVDRHFGLLANSPESPLIVEAIAETQGHSRLKDLWYLPRVQEAIATGRYDIVVLQDDPKLSNVETFEEYARTLAGNVRDAGSEPILFMAWPVEAPASMTMQEITEAHDRVSADIGVRVAPVGVAFQRVLEERPDIDPYAADEYHPSLAGTYLAANVVYATLYGEDPTGFSYAPEDMTEEVADFLQRIAWETVQGYEQA